MKTNMGVKKIFKQVISLIDRTKKNSKKKKYSEDIKDNSADKDTEKLHTIWHIFIHGQWF